MSPKENKPSGSLEPEGPAEDFLAYCEAEFERRRNAAREFDEVSCREAMDLVVRRLQALEDEDKA